MAEDKAIVSLNAQGVTGTFANGFFVAECVQSVFELEFHVDLAVSKESIRLCKREVNLREESLAFDSW